MTPEFTTDWFSTAIDGIQRSLRGMAPQRILEIGSWEGRSACWFLDTYPSATLVCVDTFQGSVEHTDEHQVAGIKDRFLKNTARFQDRVTIRQGPSSRELYGLTPESFDVIYVDGSHEEPDVMLDLVLSYGLLNPGGVLLVDDYALFPGVRKAVDKFAAVYHLQMRSVLCEYQVHFVKL